MSTRAGSRRLMLPAPLRGLAMLKRFLRFQPGWATPVPVDYSKPSMLARLLGVRGRREECRARAQGRCPGLDQCHDCAWSSSEGRR